MTRLRLWWDFIKTVWPIIAVWALCEVAILFIWGTAIGGMK